MPLRPACACALDLRPGFDLSALDCASPRCPLGLCAAALYAVCARNYSWGELLKDASMSHVDMTTSKNNDKITLVHAVVMCVFELSFFAEE